jgi:stringent starvation protein B
MCVHPYKCECLEYLKSTMCKHVHMVRMYERESGTNTVLEDVANSITKDCSEINQHHQEDVQQFVEENAPKNDEMQTDQEVVKQQKILKLRHLLII